MTMRRALLLGAILAASVIPHLKGLTAPVLDYAYHRQCNTAAIARNYHRDGLPFLSPRIDWDGGPKERAATEFPLYMWLTGLLWPVAGLGDLWGRLLSVLFSALTALYLFKFLERWMETGPAFLAAAVFGVLPLEVYFGRTVQPEALALFCTIAAFYHFDRSLEPGRPAGHWLAATALSFLAVAHKLPYAYHWLVLAALAWSRLRHGIWRDVRTILLPCVAGAGVVGWYRFASTGTYVVPTHAGEFLGLLNYGRLPYYVQFQFLSRYPELAATYGGVILAALGAKELIFKRGLAFFGLWWLSVAVYLVAGGGYTFHHEYTSLPFTLVNAALIGAGLWRLKELAKTGAPWLRVALIVLALSIPVHMALRIKHWYRVTYGFLLKAQAAAEKVSGPEDRFICNERGGSVYLYFLDRKGWSWDLREQGAASLAWIPEKVALGAKFYMTYKDASFKDESSEIARYFKRFPVVFDDGEILILDLRAQAPSGQISSRRSSSIPR